MVLSFFNIVNANSNIVYVDIDRVLTISKPGSYILKQLGDMKAVNVKDFDKKNTKGCFMRILFPLEADLFTYGEVGK